MTIGNGNDKPRVLIIDDSPTVTRIAGDMLMANNFRAVTAGSFEDVFENGFVRDVSAVLTDIILPGMSGIEGIARIRTMEPDIGVVAMSAGDASTDPMYLLKAARGAGADAVLKKPFQEDELVATMRGVIESAAKKHILVIDDSRTVCRAVSGMLPESRYTVQTADSFEQAITSHDIVGVDAVVTDIFMPGIGGIEAIRGIKNNWPQVKIIAMSGGFDKQMGSGRALEAAEKVGADGVLAKPFTGMVLQEAISNALACVREVEAFA